MGILDVMGAVAQDSVKATAELLVGRNSLVYQAGFANRDMEPVHDPLHLGPLFAPFGISRPSGISRPH